MRQYQCGDDALDEAGKEQQLIGSILEDVPQFESAGDFPAFIGEYTTEMEDELIRLADEYFNDIEDSYTQLLHTAEDVAANNQILGGSVLSLVKDVLETVLSVAETFTKMARAVEEYTSSEDVVEVKPPKKRCSFSIIFNPKTGYIEIRLDGRTQSLYMNGASPQEISQAVVTQVLLMELGEQKLFD